MALPNMEGKVVLITGASSGVGAATAEAFADAGADVALVARGVEGLERAAEEVRARGRRALVLPCDVTDQERLHEVMQETVDELGGLDVVVPNAAATIFGPFTQVEKEQFDRVVEATFIGVVNTVRAALPHLERSAGVIVATGSIMTKVPLPTFSSYAASKFAERGFLHSLRLELEAERSKVRIGMVHPGSIDTPVWDDGATATGASPRKPPEGYHPGVIARALVRVADNPVPELTIGAEAKAIELLWTNARPAGDLLLRIVHHYYLSGRKSDQSDVDALFESVGRGIVDGAKGMVSRPSAWAPVRLSLLPARMGLGLLRR